MLHKLKMYEKLNFWIKKKIFAHLSYITLSTNKIDEISNILILIGKYFQNI